MFYLLFILIFFAGVLLAAFYLGFLYLALYLAYLVSLFCVISLIILIIHFYHVIGQGNAPYIRTSKKLINKIIEVVDIKEGAKVYELGSGDSRFLRALVKSKNVQAVGYENFILPFVIGRIYNWLTHSQVKTYYSDFFKTDLSDADYVFCYLITGQMDRLEAKLKSELKPGALVISNTFKLKNWTPEKEIILNEKNKFGLSNKIYLYRK